jgi:hypothetical protein
MNLGSGVSDADVVTGCSLGLSFACIADMVCTTDYYFILGGSVIYNKKESLVHHQL